MDRRLHKLLREPNLLIPGKKPVGPVRQDMAHPLSRGLVNRWLFNEGNGRVLRDLVGQAHGTLTNGPVWAVRNRGMVIQFDGSNDHVLLPTGTAEIGNNDATVCGWIYNTGSSTYRGLIATKNTGAAGTQKGYVLGLSSANRIFWQTDNGAGLESTVGLAVLSAGWHFIAGVFENGVAMRSYLDGALDASDTTSIPSGDITSSNVPKIGCWANAIFFHNDAIADLRVYHRALSADEILTLYRDPYQDLAPANDHIWVPVAAGASHELAVADITAITFVDDVQPTQDQMLAVDEMTAATFADDVSVTHDQQITIADMMVQAQIDAITFAQDHFLTVLPVYSDSFVGDVLIQMKGIGIINDPQIDDLTAGYSIDDLTPFYEFSDLTPRRSVQEL